MCLSVVDIGTGLGWVYIYFMCYYYVPVSCGHRDRTWMGVYRFCVLLLCACQLWTKGQDLEGCIYILCVTIMCLSVVDIGTGLGWVYIDFVCH